jgi:23S rRNA (cytidine1920-2'-O)/16S rRNA (cytidine1409-2'-O)-methyltransferase
LKTRLDELLVLRGLADRIETARALILAGRVTVEGETKPSAGMRLDTGAMVDVTPHPHPYVSRGGIKLAAALEAFAIPVPGRICLDVGAATGGFTDCLLQRGAARVYAVDTGYGQIDSRLRADPRVALRENTNARWLDSSLVPEPVGIAAIDVSFISARRLLPGIAALLEPGGALVVLAKPQFEARREEVPRGGVLTDRAVQDRIVEAILSDAAALGLTSLGVIPSPIRGAKGNREFLLGFAKR